ncbi:tetratricopeptide repeat protein [Limnoglobus roseus]|uniref:Tetratricopeptide repeat protein n=1 Tax=Limnoglobus roseus TaxID=2598579 RepID=A0A5C1ABS0_9BACT|nr:hypothetical protein [Limnoglobus roseus]QEL16160.1 tetratricopeptide repeat protein [Limnoglobus roseus]
MTSSFAKFAQPSLADLTSRFLARPAALETDTSVEPHEVMAGFTADARTTWTEATAAAKFLGVKDLPATLPGEWAAHSRQASAEFLPLAIGHFPQQVRDINSLISPAKKLSTTTESRGWTATSAKSPLANALLQAASARVGGNYAEAERLLAQAETLADETAKTVVENERAALLWQQGQRTAAVAIWKQSDNRVSAFNLGMAALANGQKSEAHAHLNAAAEQLPESSGWHHLARLYLALAS